MEDYIERRVEDAPTPPREIEWSWQRLLSTDGADLADAALDSGSYDQAHFNRDFKAFLGVTPTVYRADAFAA